MRRYSYILACASGLTAHGATALAQDTETPLFLGTLPVFSTHDWDAYDGAADRAESVYIGPEELERQDPQTLKEVFASDATVQVGGAVPASQKVYVNGIEETNLAVTVDGARQNQKIFHHSSTNQIDPGLLKAVRVDPGVTAADSGPGAIAGAIAYETVDVDDLLAPDETAGGFATARYSFNGDTFVGGLAGYGRRDGFEGLAYVRYGDGGNYDDGDGDEVPGTGTDLTSFLAKGAYESETGHRFEISAMQTQDDADRPYRANIGSLIGRDEPEVREYDLTTRNVVLTYEATRATGIWQPTAQIAWSESTTDVPDPWGSEGTGEGWNGKVENRFGLGDLGSINAGVDFYSEETSYEDPFTDELTEKATNWGLYGQARLTPIQPLRVSLGLRTDQQRFEGVDGSKETNSGLSGNASVAYDINEMFTAQAGYSNVFGGIALGEPYIYNPAWVYDELEPVRSENMNAGLEFHHMGFELGASVFRTDIDNARDAVYSVSPFIPFDFRSEGYRLSAGYSWSTGFVRASFVDAEVTSDGDPVDSDTLTYFGVPSGQTIALEAVQRIDRYGLTLGGTIDAALENDDTEDLGYEALESYTVVNLWAEYQPAQYENLTLRLEANNIFDEMYSDRATYGQEFGTVEPLAEPGREIAIAARVVF
ncbi:TonB-dependent receptor domain-containing protein [Amaricoccus macauensis]|uniref:TonB-dependent receptor domain-containing protein n=1 Tax=Amaricoccus macauensis TaxID=57001 RepID=UPI003C7C9971